MSSTVRGRTYEQVAGTIDHALLQPELTLTEVAKGCELAGRYRVASVCCRPADVVLAGQVLTGSSVLVSTVIGFPHGSTTTATKVAETRRALDEGAVEFDMVLNIGWLRSGETDRVTEDIAAVVGAAQGHVVKVILENAYLTDEEKVTGCRAAEAAGAHYVKTSTGFAASGATLDDVRLMRAAVPAPMKVKAAGGVRTLDALLDMLDAGCDRVGASATARILDDFRSRTER